MGLVKITFDGSSVSAKQDADINHHLCGLIPAGIIRGLGAELKCTASNNYITFGDGYVQIYGRRIYVEEGSNVYVSLDSTKYGYVVITVNLATNNVSLGIVETTSSSYPTLTQDNLLKVNGKYQFPICKYSKTATSLTIQSFTPTYIESPGTIANSGYEKAVDYIDENLTPFSLRGYNKDKVQLTLTTNQENNYKKTLFIVRLQSGKTIAVPGMPIPSGGLSTCSIAYEIGGIEYNMIVEVYQHQLYITMGLTSHKINYVFGFR